MPFLHALPETQFVLALSIVLGAFVYEDGATVLAATLSASGRLDAGLGLCAAFVGIWVGDIGLYAMGSTFLRFSMRSTWLQKFLRGESLAKAEAWFARRGSLALVMSRAIPGSRLPLYVAAGALRFPFRLFAQITAICSAAWVSAIFAIWHFAPKPSTGPGKVFPWILTALILLSPWLGKGLFSRMRKSGTVDRQEVQAVCAP